jgi:hypothetical protein
MSNCYYCDPPWYKKTLYRLFPTKYVDRPTDGETKSIIVTTFCHFALVDRVRILISGKCRVETITLMEHDPGCVKSQGVVSVLHPWAKS